MSQMQPALTERGFPSLETALRLFAPFAAASLSLGLLGMGLYT